MRFGIVLLFSGVFGVAVGAGMLFLPLILAGCVSLWIGGLVLAFTIEG